MLFSFNEYQITKIKWCYKKIDFFVVVHCPKTDSKIWTLLEQKLKKEEIEYHKPSSSPYIRTLHKSVFSNFASSSGGISIFLYCRKSNLQNLQNLLKQNKKLIVPILIKLNNKKYQKKFLSKIFKSGYSREASLFVKTLDQSLKMFSLRNKKFKCSK